MELPALFRRRLDGRPGRAHLPGAVDGRRRLEEGAHPACAPAPRRGTELVVARGGLAVFGPGAPRRHLFAPPDALLGCKLDAADPGSALLLLRPAPGDDEPQRYRVRFDGDAAGAALAAHVSDFVSERLQ